MRIALLLAPLLACGPRARAELIDLFSPLPAETRAGGVDLSLLPGPSARATLFQALEPATLTQLGVEMDPIDSSVEHFWSLWLASPDGTLIGNDDGSGRLLHIQGIYADVGVSDYTTDVLIELLAGQHYVLMFQNNGDVLTPLFRESFQPLPLTTVGGMFSVIDGGTPSNLGNRLMPALKVGVEAAPIPEPGTLILLGAALSGVAALRHRRRHCQPPRSMVRRSP